MPGVKPYLELIRIPGVFTAQADILAGALMAGAGLAQCKDLILLLIITSCLFSAGMALNDYFDRHIDKVERPSRPIPSGRIAKTSAFGLGMALLAGGVVLAVLVNGNSFSIALVLAVAILAYDGGVKNLAWAGPVNMGLCRYLNLLLGASILPLNVELLLIPFLSWLYIFGITVLSSSEIKGWSPFSVSVCLASIAGVAISYWILGRIGILGEPLGLVLCVVWMTFAMFFPLRLYKKSTPKDYQKAIKWLLLLLVILDGVLVAGMRSVFAAFLVFLFIFPGGYIAKRFYMT